MNQPTVNPLIRLFEQYAVENHEEDLRAIMRHSDRGKHYGVVVNFVTLFEKCIELGHGILSDAAEVVPLLDSALVNAQRRILQENDQLAADGLEVKEHVHLRMTGLPACPELHRTVFPRNRDVGSLLRITGTVIRITTPKMLEYRREYLCSKCKKIFSVQAEYEQYYVIKAPTVCKNPEGCPGTNFAPIKTVDHLNYKDYQEIKIQEQVSKLSIGTVPQSMWATLEDDLVDCCKPGDDVVICGTVMRRWKGNFVVGSRMDIDLCLRVSHLSVSNDQKTAVLITNETATKFQQYWQERITDRWSARNHILASFCPEVYGLYIIKLAMSVVLAGGVGKQEETGCRVRGESHLLLVGDPGTAKSHLLRFASRVCPRSVLTTGVGSTSAGLTVSAIQEHGEWQLEAGALVLADGGICCIDEFSCIRQHDRTAIHEAMEQQTISVAKAGVVCKLNTRCTIIAATNPKGHYDPTVPMTVNVAIASPLLSRFDIVLVLLDCKNREWDKLVSDFILYGDRIADSSSSSLWSVEKLQEYFCIIKTLHPKLTEDANRILSLYYQAQRRADIRNEARTTVRLLESLIRLAQGHARLMFREEVLAEDAIVSVTLIESSMLGTALIGNVNALHTSFPSDPETEYRRQAKLVLQKLGLTDILDKMQAQPHQERLMNPPNTNVEIDNKRDVLDTACSSNQLSNILTNIKRNKDRTIFNSVQHERKTRQNLKTKINKTQNAKTSVLERLTNDSEPKQKRQRGQCRNSFGINRNYCISNSDSDTGAVTEKKVRLNTTFLRTDLLSSDDETFIRKEDDRNLVVSTALKKELQESTMDNDSSTSSSKELRESTRDDYRIYKKCEIRTDSDKTPGQDSLIMFDRFSDQVTIQNESNLSCHTHSKAHTSPKVDAALDKHTDRCKEATDKHIPVASSALSKLKKFIFTGSRKNSGSKSDMNTSVSCPKNRAETLDIDSGVIEDKEHTKCKNVHSDTSKPCDVENNTKNLKSNEESRIDGAYQQDLNNCRNVVSDSGNSSFHAQNASLKSKFEIKKSLPSMNKNPESSAKNGSDVVDNSKNCSNIEDVHVGQPDISIRKTGVFLQESIFNTFDEDIDDILSSPLSQKVTHSNLVNQSADNSFLKLLSGDFATDPTSKLDSVSERTTLFSCLNFEDEDLNLPDDL